MRAMKRTVSVLLSLMLVLGMMTIGMSAVGAAETHKVNVKSNIGEDTAVDFTASSEQVTVTYKLKADLDIVNAQGVITYDPAVLKIASTNTAKTVMPNFENYRTVNLTKKDGRIPFNCSDFEYGYDFKTEAVFATVVFDILDASADTDVNLNVSILTASTALDTTSENDVALVDGDVVDSSKFTSTTEAKVTPESVDPSVFINDVRINLEGKIGIDFYFNYRLTDYDPANISVKFDGPSATENASVNGETGKVALKSMKGVMRNGTPVYKQSYFVCAYMMTAPLVVEIYDGSERVTSYTVDVAGWAKEHLAEFESSNPAAATLVKNMLNYGACVQTYFNSTIDAKFTAPLANEGVSYPLTLIDADQIVVPSGVGTIPTLTDIGITALRPGVELKEGVDIQLTVRIDAAKFAGTTVSCEGTNLPFENSGTSGVQKRAILYNVVSNKLDNVYTFTFNNGAVYKTSVMSYLKTLLSSTTDDNLKKLISSIYWYNQSAKAVFG